MLLLFANSLNCGRDYIAVIGVVKCYLPDRKIMKRGYLAE